MVIHLRACDPDDVMGDPSEQQLYSHEGYDFAESRACTLTGIPLRGYSRLASDCEHMRRLVGELTEDPFKRLHRLVDQSLSPSGSGRLYDADVIDAVQPLVDMLNECDRLQRLDSERAEEVRQQGPITGRLRRKPRVCYVCCTERTGFDDCRCHWASDGRWRHRRQPGGAM